MLVKRYKVVALYPLPKDKLNAEKVDEIMREVAEQFGATKKVSCTRLRARNLLTVAFDLFGTAFGW